MESITELDGVKYKYEYKASNNFGEISFNDSAVVGLEVTDNLFNPFVSGSITIINSFNSIEKEFLFRGDGSDTFTIILYPEGKQDKKIQLEFTITDESNYIDNLSPIKNRKQYSLIDKDESTFRSKFPYGIRAYGKGGLILKDILKKLKLPINEEKFEECDFSIDSFPLYITPSLNYKYIDLLYYVLQYNYAIEGDIAVKPILKKEDGKYQLEKITKLFEENNKRVYEAFNSGDLVSSPSPDSNPNNPPPKAPVKTFTSGSPEYSIFTPDTSISYTFFKNTLSVSYDPILGDFYTNEIRIKDIRDKWQKKFVDVFSAIGGAPKPFLNLTEDKKGGEFKVYRLPFTSKHNYNIVVSDTINNLTMYNLQLTLDVVGDTGRKAGTFIDIFKGKNDKNPADSKLLGRWLVTTVKHLKINNRLRTILYCVKTYVGPTFNQQDV